MVKIENNNKYRILSLFVDNLEDNLLESDRKMEVNVLKHLLVIVQNGGILVELGSKQVELHKNEVLLIRKNRKIILKNHVKETTAFQLLTFDGNGSTAMLDYLKIMDYFFFSIKGNIISVSLDRLIQYYKNNEYFRAAIELQQILITAKETPELNYHRSNMEHIYHYIQENFSKPMDLYTLAEMYGTSISYFSRAFKHFFQMTPMNYVNELRIEHAKMLLEDKKMKIKDISEVCGFDKVEYFCYVFKKKEGCTPSQFRNNRKIMEKI